jgi:hypothetical protein
MVALPLHPARRRSEPESGVKGDDAARCDIPLRISVDASCSVQLPTQRWTTRNGRLGLLAHIVSSLHPRPIMIPPPIFASVELTPQELPSDRVRPGPRWPSTEVLKRKAHASTNRASVSAGSSRDLKQTLAGAGVKGEAKKRIDFKEFRARVSREKRGDAGPQRRPADCPSSLPDRIFTSIRFRHADQACSTSSATSGAFAGTGRQRGRCRNHVS